MERMRILFAAVGAVLAALVETSVLSDVTVAGGSLHLVFALTIVATLVIGVEDGLSWAFLGGLVLDIVLPERRMGMTSLVLLLSAGVAAVIGHLLPQQRVVVTTATVLVLSLAYQAMIVVLLAGTAGASASVSITAFVPGALFDAAAAAAAALLAREVLIRVAPRERALW
jgi:rod shape-determining protein MreD